jgi:excisionase family DNA binding protein
MQKVRLGIGTTEAAVRLDVTEQTVRKWCAEGFGIRVGGRWRIREDLVEELENKLRGAGERVDR